MKTFLRPTIFKIIITTILLVVIFSFPILYTLTLTITGQGPHQGNFLMVVINGIIYIIYYPILLILNFTNNLVIRTVINLILTVLETYLISCCIGMLIDKLKR